jgi:predicted transcriptional regulator
MRLIMIIALCIGTILLISLPAMAYGAYYSISGTVIDNQDNPVSGANVTLVYPDYQPINSTLTNETGYYYFMNKQEYGQSIVKVIVSYVDGNQTYRVRPEWTRWVNAEGDVVINTSDTQFQDYPPDKNGYILGELQINTRGASVDGEVYLISTDNVTQYHTNATNSSGFIFYVPSGSYDIYAVHNESGLRYTSEIKRVNTSAGWEWNGSIYGESEFGNITQTVLILEQGISPPGWPSPSPMANTTAILDTPVKKAAAATAGGVAATAVAYTFVKFFGIGAVARAKDRLDKNDNRSKLMMFIKENPGVTLHELSRSLGMNVGTARYHLFILGLNHRIVSSKFDEKFVRYFPNSGSYSKNEQLAISLVRRDGVRKLLSLLLEKPGLSNLEISKQLDIRDNAVSRYIKELMEIEVVLKKPTDGGMSLYYINEVYKNTIASMLERTV